MKGIKRVLTFALAVMLAIGIIALPVSARPVYIGTANWLDIYLIEPGGQSVRVHRYSISELEAISHGHGVFYSSIDAMPALVLTVANGVYFRDLFGDLQSRGHAVANFDRIIIRAPDGWQRAFTEAELFRQRYYFPGLFNAELIRGGAGRGTVDPHEVGPGIPVEPMLAVTSWQARIPEVHPTVPLSAGEIVVSGSDRLRFCIGMLPDDLTNGISTTAGFGRGVNRIDIVVGGSVETGAHGQQQQVPVTGLEITTPENSRATLGVGSSLPIIARAVPANATNTNVIWRSVNPDVATITNEGIVRAVSPGEALITATSEDNPLVTVPVTITVTQADAVRVTGITLDRNEATIRRDNSTRLIATVFPANATNMSINWSSSAPGIASVDSNGNVTGHSAGTAIIAAETVDGSFRATGTITVVLEEVRVTGVTLAPGTASVRRGNSIRLTATISPSNATDRSLRWSSSAPGVASVDPEGNVIGRGEGTAVITAETVDGEFTASGTVRVFNEGILFGDAANHWAIGNIERLAELGAIHESPSGNFYPNADITRVDFTAMLMGTMASIGRAEIEPGESFEDVRGHWAEDLISTAVQMGIITGFDSNTFGPDRKITREQMAAILSRAASLAPSGDLGDFTDGYTVSLWARDSVVAASEAGLFVGGPDGRFRPLDNTSRAEGATLVARFFDIINEQ